MKTAARANLLGTLALSAGSISIFAQARTATRYPVDAEAVVRALHADGLDVQAGDVRMSAPASASVRNPALELFGADRLPDGHLRIRLRCRAATECLPFSVTLGRFNASSAVSANPLLRASTSSSAKSVRDETSLAPVADGLSPAAELPASPLAVAPAAFPAGARLTLLMEDGHLHIHLPVIALDSSAAGHEVRVCTLDRKRTFRATVVDTSTVRGIVE